LHGPRILVTSTQRRPKDLLAAIRLLTAIEAAPPTSRAMARALVDIAVRHPNRDGEVERILGVEPGSLKKLHDKLVASAAANYEAGRLAARATVPPPPPPTSVPVVPRHEVPDGYISPEEEEANSLRKMMRGWDDRHAPTVHRRKPQ
jgi:hypothetical protein